MAPNKIVIVNELSAWKPAATSSPMRCDGLPLTELPVQQETAALSSECVTSINREKKSLETLEDQNESKSIKIMQPRELFSECQGTPGSQKICEDESSRNNADDKRELLVLGNFVGKLLEAFPIIIRSKAVKDIEEAEQRYCLEVKKSHCLRPILAPQLWKIEHIRRVPELNRDPRMNSRNTVMSYGETIESYLASIPLELRTGILKEICSIVSYYGSKNQKG